jgi:hypothetical protein
MGIDRLRLHAASGTHEEPLQDSRSGELQEPGVRAGRGAEPGNDLRLLSVDDAHHGKFREKMPVAFLKHDSLVIPTH